MSVPHEKGTFWHYFNIFIVLWSWFPFGRAGIRTGLLFICAFSIFVLRVGQLHVGLRTTPSGFQTFRKYALRSQTLQTAGWYSFSAWLYCEVYIFSASADANIRWITDTRNGERPRLNERPIYLTSYLIMLALLQSWCHLYYDYDRVDMPVTKTKPESSSDQRAHLIVPPSTQLKTLLPTLAASAARRALFMAMAGPFIYTLAIRHTAWNWTLSLAKIFWSLPRSTALPAIAPFHYKFLIRSFAAGFLLLMMWEISNAAFSAYVAQEPLKNERPITYESRDPNGSLLTGLNGKKLHTRVSLMVC
jgi:nucleoporin NDC1